MDKTTECVELKERYDIGDIGADQNVPSDRSIRRVRLTHKRARAVPNICSGEMELTKRRLTIVCMKKNCVCISKCVAI